MFKGSLEQEDATIINIYESNIEAPQNIRQTLTDRKGEIDTNTIIIGDFNTALTPIDRPSKQKINKETQVLNDTLDETDLTDNFRTFHWNAEENTFSNAHGPFSGIDHILSYKTSLSKSKKIEIISSIFWVHNIIRLDINYKRKTVKNANTWRLNSMFLNNQVTEKNQMGNQIYLETNDNENTTQNLWDTEKVVLRGKFIAIQSYIKKQEKHWIDNLALQLKQLEKRRTTTKNKKISRRKEIIKIWAEINEKEMKDVILKINKIKSSFFEKIKLTSY